MIENFKFKKQFGQNFLTDTNLLASIVRDSKIDKNSTVVEVGAGAGALTSEICNVAKKVVAFEIDLDLKDYLTNKFAETKNLQIVFCDALKLSNSEINEIAKNKFHLIANLPYYITTPLIFKFLENENCLSLTIMVQKEVASRIVAKPSTKDFGILTAKLNAFANCEICRIVSRKLFTPMPNVDSAIVRIEKKSFNFNAEIFNKIIDKAFSMRRKTLQNNLCNNFISKEEFFEICSKLSISPSVRAEALKVEDFINISKLVEQIRQ